MVRIKFIASEVVDITLPVFGFCSIWFFDAFSLRRHENANLFKDFTVLLLFTNEG